MKQSFIYANMQLMFKNPPDEYRGIVRENWTICNDGPNALSVILWGLIKNTVLFYCETMKLISAEEINSELDKLISHLSHFRITREIEQDETKEKEGK